MYTLLLLATAKGLVLCHREASGWHELRRSLAGRRLTGVIAREGVILAGTEAGILRSDNLGQSWQDASAGLSVRHVRWLAYHPDISNLEFAGTEPAAIFVSQDGARTWQERSEVARLRSEHGWYLPYSPEAGCVRGFAFHGSRVYAAVEVGGVLRSDNNGQTWQLAPGSTGDPQDEPAAAQGQIHPDVHSIAVHPSSPDLVSAPTGGGFYRTEDGGRTWQFRYDCYCRAVWLDPKDPQHLVLGPADGVDRNGRIEQTFDGGLTWQMASAGLDVPWPRYMVERFSQAGDELLAVLSNGDLLAAPLDSLAWRRILPAVPEVAAVTRLSAT